MGTSRLRSFSRVPVADSGAELLGRYTRDHWAAAGAGRALAHRLWRNNVDTPWSHQLDGICREIAADDDTLSALRRRLGHGGGRLRRVAALVAERVARLKLNGRLTGYSPLSRVLEAESLLAGVQAKALLWTAVATSMGPTAGLDLDLLRERAGQQQAVLAEFHRWAALEAFQDRTDHTPAAADRPPGPVA